MNVALSNEKKAKIVHSSIHDLTTDCFAIFLTKHFLYEMSHMYAELVTATLQTVYRDAPAPTGETGKLTHSQH